MVQIQQRVVIHCHPIRELILGFSDIVLFRVLIPPLKRAKSVGSVYRIRKPQTEAGSRKSQRPHFGILSMRTDRALAPLSTDVLIKQAVRVMKSMFTVIYDGEAVIVLSVT